MAASLASTGTPAHFVHATEWAHGDLGIAIHQFDNFYNFFPESIKMINLPLAKEIDFD